MYTQMKENARVNITRPLVSVGHLGDGDVVDSCFTSRREHGGQNKGT